MKKWGIIRIFVRDLNKISVIIIRNFFQERTYEDNR
jgi:hypothetical protein